MGIKSDDRVDFDFLNSLIGLSLFHTKHKIENSEYVMGKIAYEESKENRLKIIDAHLRFLPGGGKCIDLKVAGVNPITFLPSIYQNNDFLKRFLWIIQHQLYDTISTLDNLHNQFTPVEASEPFLNWIASWFNINNKVNMSSSRLRMFLQKAIALFRWRGTRIGMKGLIEIVTGVRPEIHENSFPLSEYTLYGKKTADTIILDTYSPDTEFFTVHFPVPHDYFDKSMKVVISELIKRERPVNTIFYITYTKVEVNRKKGDLIGSSTIIKESGVEA